MQKSLALEEKKGLQILKALNIDEKTRRREIRQEKTPDPIEVKSPPTTIHGG